MKLQGNTVLITGGTSGIGYELAKQLLALGNAVIITGRDEKKLAQAELALPGVTAIRSDVSRPEEVEALFATVTRRFPELNVLVNNAGVMREINLHSAISGPGSLDDLTREIDVNLKGPIQMAKVFLPHLKALPRAALVNVTSGLAFVPLPSSPVYCATKAALHSFTLSLRVQLKNTAVQVFELAPPATATELLQASMHPDDKKGIRIMEVEAMVRAALAGISRDELEICPGQSSQLRFMSRFAPAFILRQLSRPVDRMLRQLG